MTTSPLTLAVPLAGVAAAGFLRGLSGFGFALVAVPLLTFALPAREAVPLAAALQCLSCLPVLGPDRRHADWPRVALLALSALAGLVPGLLLLRRVDNQVLRLVIGVSMSTCVVALASGRDLRLRQGPALVGGSGALAGLLQGLAGMAGPPVILLLMSSQGPARRTRATLVAFFLCVSGAGFLGAALVGLVTVRTLELVLACAPAMVLGLHAGRRAFGRLSERGYRRAALALLGVIALSTLVSAGLHLLRPAAAPAPPAPTARPG